MRMAVTVTRSPSDLRPQTLLTGVRSPESGLESVRGLLCQSPGMKGFSLLEVVLAFLILGLALAPILSLFPSAGKQARQTSDVGQALALQERTAEELRVAAWENPHLARGLSLDPQCSQDLPVVDGGSPFFRAVENDLAPGGPLVPGPDSSINAQKPSLYRALRTYRFSVRSQMRALPTTGQVLDLSFRTLWKDFANRDSTLEMTTVVPVYSVRQGTPWVVKSRERADRLIVKACYPSRSGLSLPQLFSSGNLAAMRDLGDMVIVMLPLVYWTSYYDAQVSQFESMATTASSDIDLFRIRLAQGRLHEARAAACVNAMVYLAPALQRMATALDPATLNPKPPLVLIRNMAIETALIRAEFHRALTAAVSAYCGAYNSPGAGQLTRVQARAFLRAIDCIKLQTLTIGPEDTTFLKSMLVGFLAVEEGRDQYYADYARVESEHVLSTNSLRASFPNQSLIKGWKLYNAALEPGVTEVLHRTAGASSSSSVVGVSPASLTTE